MAASVLDDWLLEGVETRDEIENQWGQGWDVGEPEAARAWCGSVGAGWLEGVGLLRLIEI